MRTENLAIAFVDIAGFTERTARQSRADNERLLRAFGEIVRPAVKGFGGRVVKSIGDAFLMTFRSPTEAIHCAMAIHDRLAKLNRGAREADRFDLRVAINAGDVRVEGGDVFGEAVNIAARIESKTPAGDIYFSEAIYLAMTKAEVPSEEVGLAELKGITDAIRLYRVPRAREVGGYQLTGKSAGPTAADDSPDDAETLPYGGLGLARMSNNVSPKLFAAAGLDKLLGGVAPVAKRGGALATQGWRGFLARMRGSKRFRLVTIGIIAAVTIAIIVALAWPKPKAMPLTPWQKIKRGLGV